MNCIFVWETAHFLSHTNFLGFFPTHCCILCSRDAFVVFTIQCLHSLIFHLCVFQFRGSEILELANFKNATIEDIANVHEKAYVLGLEKVIYFPHVILLPIDNKECEFEFYLTIYKLILSLGNG